MKKCKDCDKVHDKENTGCENSGYLNSGDRNSGNRNSGNLNSGDWNSGDLNSGYFNTDSPDKVRIFNTWVEMTHEEFNSKYNIYADLPLNRWKNYEQMEEQEKKDFPFAKDIGGYLKTLDFKEACQIWWDEHEGSHNDFLSLPNFDATIFEEITGIKVNQSKEQDLDIIELKGKKYKLLED